MIAGAIIGALAGNAMTVAAQQRPDSPPTLSAVVAPAAYLPRLDVLW
jgi:hypothetical protein